jgi:hypothetical protein
VYFYSYAKPHFDKEKKDEIEKIGSSSSEK